MSMPLHLLNGARLRVRDTILFISAAPDKEMREAEDESEAYRWAALIESPR